MSIVLCLLMLHLYIEANILKYFTNTIKFNCYFFLCRLLKAQSLLKIRQYEVITQDR